MDATKRLAVVTGANRGIGFETCRQLAKAGFQVILTSRDRTKGEAAAQQLQQTGLDVLSYSLDVTNQASIEQLAQFIKEKFNRLDVLVNNAGVYLDNSNGSSSILNAKLDTLQQTLETNLYGPLMLCQALIPLMKVNNFGRIINVSSGMGQLTDMTGDSPAYRISKTSLNALTRILADELKSTGIVVNSICPGWVKTDMGGANAPRTPEQGADTIVWLATQPESETGGFFRDRQPIPW